MKWIINCQLELQALLKLDFNGHLYSSFYVSVMRENFSSLESRRNGRIVPATVSVRSSDDKESAAKNTSPDRNFCCNFEEINVKITSSLKSQNIFV